MQLFVGAYHGASLVSHTIQAATWSPISHLSLINDTAKTIEAWHVGGVSAVADPWVNHTPGTPIDLLALDCEPVTAAKIWQAALNEIGQGYDYLGVLAFLPGLHWLPSRPERWFCSELVVHACKKGGHPLFNTLAQARRLSPGKTIITPRLNPLGQIINLAIFHQLIASPYKL